MNSVINFVKLDFLTLKPYAKSIMMLPLLGIFMSVAMKTTSWLTTYFMVGIVMIVTYPFSISETNNMDILYATLPLNRRAIVRGRYAFALTSNILVCALTVVLSLILTAVLRLENSTSELIMTSAILLPLFSLITAIQFPLYFKWGYSKVKWVSMMPFLVIFLLFILAGSIVEMLNINIDLSFLETIAEMSPVLISIPVVIVTLALQGVSYLISCKLYVHRDL